MANEFSWKTVDGLILPLPFRWFAAQGSLSFEPWIILNDLSKAEPVRDAFKAENTQGGDVIPIAKRVDCDDYAGFELKDNKILDTVVYFHPAFNRLPNNGIIMSVHMSLWSFFKEIIVPDMEDWASEDALDNLISHDGAQ